MFVPHLYKWYTLKHIGVRNFPALPFFWLAFLLLFFEIIIIVYLCRIKYYQRSMSWSICLSQTCCGQMQCGWLLTGTGTALYFWLGFTMKGLLKTQMCQVFVFNILCIVSALDGDLGANWVFYLLLFGFILFCFCTCGLLI